MTAPRHTRAALVAALAAATFLPAATYHVATTGSDDDTGGAGDPWGGGILFENPVATNVVVRNNLVSQNLSFQIGDESSGAGLVVDHNLIDGFRGETGEIWGTNSVTGDPLFVSTSTPDYHLQSNSPAIDAATATDAPSHDHDRGGRPVGAGTDLGAYEWGHLFSDDFEWDEPALWTHS